MVTDDWANDVQEELISLLVSAGVAPVKGQRDQVLQAIHRLAQIQKSTAFTTGGVPGSLTLTPAPALTTITANQRFRVKFSQASTGLDTLNVSALGTVLIRQYTSAGVRVPAVFSVGQLSDVEYDGVYFILLNALPPSVVPTGATLGFYLTSAPSGFLKENGAAVSRTTYSALFSVIGTAFGSGDGSTTFNLPDHRAEFPRGADDTRGVDAGRTVGSTQAQAIQSHDHVSGSYGNSTGSGGTVANNVGLSGGSDRVWTNTMATGGTETRPRNIAKLYCIKF
jgi:microcystin-dependent protein